MIVLDPTFRFDGSISNFLVMKVSFPTFRFDGSGSDFLFRWLRFKFFVLIVPNPT